MKKMFLKKRSPKVKRSERFSEIMGSKMKEFEKKLELKISGETTFVMRIDGHGFSKFTKGLNKPFDLNLHQAMIDTLLDLVKEYRPDLGYTHSDEISLIFLPKKTKLGNGFREPMFQGRVQKIVSIVAGFTTSAFNRNISRLFQGKESLYKPHVFERVAKGHAYFDARIFEVPDLKTIQDYLYWRSVIDCRRNNINGLARKYFSKTELNKKSNGDQLKMLEKKGVIWNDQHPAFKNGSFCKSGKRNDQKNLPHYAPLIFYKKLSQEPDEAFLKFISEDCFVEDLHSTLVYPDKEQKFYKTDFWLENYNKKSKKDDSDDEEIKEE